MPSQTFLQAMKAFFGTERPLTVPEFKELTTQDKIELSESLMKVPNFEHIKYEPKV